MDVPLSLLVVDVSEDWEDVLKAQERGYFIEWNHRAPGGYERGQLNPDEILTIRYPHGSVRAGLNAIVDTARIAHQYRIPVYTVEYPGECSDGEEQPCYLLHPYVPESNRYRKHTLSAFGCSLADRLAAEGCKHLMVVGYDRDDCVLATIRDAVERGIAVVTSEHCMLTADRGNRREASMAWFREHTTYLETLVDVWNCLLGARG